LKRKSKQGRRERAKRALQGIVLFLALLLSGFLLGLLSGRFGTIGQGIETRRLEDTIYDDRQNQVNKQEGQGKHDPAQHLLVFPGDRAMALRREQPALLNGADAPPDYQHDS
jgi:hypothetical protein